MSKILATTALLGLSSSVLAAPQIAGVPPIQPRMGDPVAGLSPAELARFEEGRVAFGTNLTPETGLGPIFNETSCGSCHSQPAIGGASTFLVTRFGKAAAGGNPFDPLASLGGGLLQLQATDPSCQEVIPMEADHVIQRLTPICNGLGLVEAIVDADILARESSPPAGVSGLSKTVGLLEGGADRLGRFGWKGDVATARSFSIDAGLNELGLTSAELPEDNAPNGDTAARDLCDIAADPEATPDAMGFTMIDRFTDFQRFLAPPPQTPKAGMAGEALFEAIGCAACHVSDPYTTGTVAEASLSGIDIQPYSDFLLHDMGSLGDGVVSGVATEREMMTRSLWGLAFRSSMLHDGRASSGSFQALITTAIDEHDGEAAASRTAFLALSASEQAQVAEFLQSLGQAEFDFERDNDVDAFDWFFLEPELTGPVGSIAPDDRAAIADIDSDGDFDLADFAAVQRAFSGQIF